MAGGKRYSDKHGAVGRILDLPGCPTVSIKILIYIHTGIFSIRESADGKPHPFFGRGTVGSGLKV
jgi:hypothetical protein